MSHKLDPIKSYFIILMTVFSHKWNLKLLPKISEIILNFFIVNRFQIEFLIIMSDSFYWSDAKDLTKSWFFTTSRLKFHVFVNSVEKIFRNYLISVKLIEKSLAGFRRYVCLYKILLMATQFEFSIIDYHLDFFFLISVEN